MRITDSRAHGRTALAALLALATIAAGVGAERGQARGTPITPTSELRIEGPARNVDPGTWYVTPPERVKRSRGLGCRHRDGRLEVQPSALSIAESAAAASGGMPPVRVRPDDFGLFVCEIDGRIGRPFDHPDGFSGWTYWLDFTGGTQAAENELLAGGEQVLWVFADFGPKDRNTGGALELTAPAYDADGTFIVRVQTHSFAGTATDLEGAKIKGASEVDDQGAGEYEVTVPNGFTTLFARHKPDIASNRGKVCVKPSASQCPDEHGRTIVGSADADTLPGTGGWDRIRSRGGDDHILIDDGGRDKVNCGAGDDLVRLVSADADDELAANCEETEEAT